MTCFGLKAFSQEHRQGRANRAAASAIALPVYGQDYQRHILNCERLEDINTDKLQDMDMATVLLARAKAAEKWSY
jgi:hypothetical protein